MPYTPKSPERRYAESTRRLSSGCLVWTGKTHRGYPAFKVNGIRVSVRRWAYAHYVESIPDGWVLFALPTCQRTCVNPGHLIPRDHDYHMRQLHQKRA